MDIYEEITGFYESATTQKTVYGKSVLGRNLYAVKVGDGSPVGIAVYAIHAREYITARLAKIHFQTGVKKGSLWILPLSNPDGALLSQIGLPSVSDEKTRAWLSGFSKEALRLWKANANGVDLNVNFPADWGKGTKNVFVRGAENYVGEAPCSERETNALKAFTEAIMPDYTVSYHTKGEEIYWYYFQPLSACARDKRLAQALSRATGYPLKQAKGSVGGYKDWCIQALKIPSFTIEAGNDGFSHPLGDEAFEDMAQKNACAIYKLSEEL